MIEFKDKIETAARIDVRLPMTFDERKRGRIKVMTETGEEAGLFLERGHTLHDGQLLQAADGRVGQVIAAPEALTEARSNDPLIFAKVCYHLGNRHTPIQIEPGVVRFQPDHVLAEMCLDWGLAVEMTEEPFAPESGAYGKHKGHSHAH